MTALDQLNIKSRELTHPKFPDDANPVKYVVHTIWERSNGKCMVGSVDGDDFDALITESVTVPPPGPPARPVELVVWNWVDKTRETIVLNK